MATDALIVKHTSLSSSHRLHIAVRILCLPWQRVALVAERFCDGMGRRNRGRDWKVGWLVARGGLADVLCGARAGPAAVGMHPGEMLCC